MNHPSPSAIHEGIAHHQAGRLAEAEVVYRRILSANPNDPDALNLLGVIAYQVKQYAPAEQLIKRAIAINPHVPLYHNNIGGVFRALGRRKEAAEAYTIALQLKPDYAEACANLGNVFRDQAMFTDAVKAFETSVRLSPTVAEPWGSLGTALKDQGRIDEAIKAYRRAIELRPTFVEAHSNLIYALHASDSVSPQEIFAEHRHWAAAHAGGVSGAVSYDNTRDPNRRLRIGYISADFRDHPVARFMLPLLTHHNRDDFEIMCFSDAEWPDSVTAEMKSLVHGWHETAGVPDTALADLIRRERIDILVDLAGHAGSNRILVFARRLAPVQMTYLGYPDTTGIEGVQYRITDALADPIGLTESLHTEMLVRIDGCFLCYPMSADLPSIAPLSAAPAGFVTFGSFNNLAKISRTTIKLWSSVLRAVPESRMLIKTTSCGDAQTRALAAKRFGEWGLPMDRVELRGPEPTQELHLRSYAQVDVALDTYPYNGTTTTCEGLAMGVPVVSLFGQHHAARVGLSILSAAGWGDWATDDPQHFTEIAAFLASDAGRLANLRAGMRDQLKASKLCDGPVFTRKIESAYRDVWVRWCAT